MRFIVKIFILNHNSTKNYKTASYNSIPNSFHLTKLKTEIIIYEAKLNLDMKSSINQTKLSLISIDIKSLSAYM